MQKQLMLFRRAVANFNIAQNTILSALNIVWMKPYHCTRLRLSVLCKLWTEPFKKVKILCEAMIDLEKNFWMIYSNTRLRTHETLPLRSVLRPEKNINNEMGSLCANIYLQPIHVHVAHYQIPIKITAFSMHPPWKGFLFKYMWRIKYANTPKLVAPFFCVDPTFPFQFPCTKIKL